jgi:hypothetical protein
LVFAARLSADLDNLDYGTGQTYVTHFKSHRLAQAGLVNPTSVAICHSDRSAFKTACSRWLSQDFLCSSGAHIVHTPPSNYLKKLSSRSNPSWGSLSEIQPA